MTPKTTTVPEPAPEITFVDAMDAASLFRPWFTGDSWRYWREVARAMDGTPVRDIELFREIAGDRVPPTEPCRELWAICGRRAGKSQFSAARACFEAAYRSYRAFLKPGELGVVMLVAADRDQAQVLFGYVNAMTTEIPALAAMVTNRTMDTIELNNGLAIKVTTCNFRRIRGRTVVACVLDEVGFWISELDSRNADRDVLAAIRPSMATIPNARLIVISSPWAKRGVLWDAFKKWWGKTVKGVLVIRAGTATMNPKIDPGFLADEREKDPVAARAEYDAWFRDDLESFISDEAVDAVTVTGRHRLPYVGATQPYYGFVDTAGGTGADSLALCIVTRVNRMVSVVSLDEWVPPFDPQVVAPLVARRLKEYGLTGCAGDRFSGGTWASILKAHGVRYSFSKLTKSQLLHNLLPRITGKQVELPDHKRMRNQLLALERSTTKNDADSISHPPGGHDDLINAVAGAVEMAAKPKALEGHTDGSTGTTEARPGVIHEVVRKVMGQSIIVRIFPDGREVLDRLGGEPQLQPDQPYLETLFCMVCRLPKEGAQYLCGDNGPEVHDYCKACRLKPSGLGWCPKCDREDVRPDQPKGVLV